MRRAELLLFSLVVSGLVLGIYFNINLIWVFVDFLLTGTIPFINFSIGTIGSVLFLSFIFLIARNILRDTKMDYYEKSLVKNKNSNYEKKGSSSSKLETYFKETNDTQTTTQVAKIDDSKEVEDLETATA